MDKVEKVFTLIYNDYKLKEELIKKQTIDEMYEYCTSILGGYTKEEFEDFVNKMCQYVKDELTNNNLSISDEDMKKISGGTQLKNKAISSLLAAITISTPLVGAAGSDQENANVPPENKVSFIQKAKDFVSKDPTKSGVTAAGISLAVMLGVALNRNRKNDATSTNNTMQDSQPAPVSQDVPSVPGHNNAGVAPNDGIPEEEQVVQGIITAVGQTRTQVIELWGNLERDYYNLPENANDLTRQNVGNVEQQLRTLNEVLVAARAEMDANQELINRIVTPELKNNAQNAWNAENARIIQIDNDRNNMARLILEKIDILHQREERERERERQRQAIFDRPHGM